MSSENQEFLSNDAGLYYIHLENLPWSACHHDVFKFFDGIAMPPGGISIYGKDAFIVVTNKKDLDKALAMSGQDIHGEAVFLSSSKKINLFRLKCRYISRKLQFSPYVRRIRPTVIPDVSENMFKVFNPQETEISDENKEVNSQQPNKRKSKKIRPTLLKDLTQLQVFEESDTNADGQCLKKMKLADNWLLSHLEV